MPPPCISGAAAETPTEPAGRFTVANTDGYDAADIAHLNHAFVTIIVDFAICEGCEPDAQYQEYIAERLLAAYDCGCRGESLWEV